jgi:hypothetical protein
VIDGASFGSANLKNKPNWAMWEMIFIVALAVTNLQRSKPVDAAHARSLALFQLGVSVICAGGFLTVQVLKRRAGTVDPRADATATLPVPSIDDEVPTLSADDREITVTYRSTREATWSCNLIP